MKRRLLILAGAGVLGAGLLAGPLSAAPPGTDYNTPHQQAGPDCSQQGAPQLSLSYYGPTSMWPPNHKYQPFSITGTSSLGGPVTLDTSGTHDQYDGDTEMTGTGHTADDIVPNDDQATTASASTAKAPAATEDGTGSVTTDWEARSERAGAVKAGRTYTVTGTIHQGPTSCTGTWTLTVPHDQRVANRQG